MNAAQLQSASKMWKEGMLASAIARQLGVKVKAVLRVSQRKRAMFPIRQHAQSIGRRNASANPRPLPAAPFVHHDRVRWINENGSVVTLPRVSMISCPRGS